MLIIIYGIYRTKQNLRFGILILILEIEHLQVKGKFSRSISVCHVST